MTATSTAPDPFTDRHERVLEGVRFACELLAVMPPHMWLIADHLGRRFSIPRLRRAPAAYLDHVDRLVDAPQDVAEHRVLLRLLDPDVTATMAEISSAEWEQPIMLGRALYADHHPDPDRLGAIIARRGRDPGNSRTHAALALRWVEELGREVAGHVRLRNDLVEGMIDEIETEPLPPLRSDRFDLFAEQVAMIGYLGGTDRVDGCWIDHLLAEQEVDGGWGGHHTTMLALWCVLEGVVADPQPGGWIPVVPRDPREHERVRLC